MRSSLTTPVRRSMSSVEPSPRPKQLEAVRFLLSRPEGGLFADPGAGKTRCSLITMRALLEQNRVKRWLVIAPIRPLYATWPVENQKWAVDLSMMILHGKDKEHAVRAKHEVGLLNPDGLNWLTRLPPALIKQYDGLIVDESTKFKHTGTQRFKMIKKLLDNFSRRYILTGTPSPNGLLDLFGQVYLMDQGETLGRYVTHYKVSYFTPVGYGGYQWVPNKGAEEMIYDKLAPLVMRIENDGMPELVEDRIMIVLPAKARELYDTLEDELVVKLSGEKKITAANAAVASMKCRQVASGGIYLDKEVVPDDEVGLPHAKARRAVQQVHTEKLDALKDLVEQLQGTPLLVGYEFQHELEVLRKAFPTWPIVAGGMKPDDMIHIQDAFNAGEVPGILAQIEATAHGLNLQEGPGHHLAIYTCTWDLEALDQFIRRVWRPGQQSKTVFVHYFLADKTVDQDVLTAVRRKDKSQKALLDALRERTKDRVS